MTNQEQLKMYQDLIFANEQLKILIQDFKTLEKNSQIIESIKSLKNVDANIINQGLQKLNFTEIGADFLKKIESELKSSSSTIKKAEDELNITSKKLEEKISLYMETVEGLNQIEHMSEDIESINKGFEKLKNRSIFLPAFIAAFSVGFFSFFASNINAFFQEKIPGESEFVKLIDDSYFFVDSENRNIVYLNIPKKVSVSQFMDSVNSERYILQFERRH